MWSERLPSIIGPEVSLTQRLGAAGVAFGFAAAIVLGMI